MDKDTTWEAHADGELDEMEEPPLVAPDDHERRVMICRSCHLPRVFRRRKPRHSLHFALSIGTLGLWLPVWGLLIILQRFHAWDCTVCGIHQRND